MNIRPGDLPRAIAVIVMLLGLLGVLSLAYWRQTYDESLVCHSGEVLVKNYLDNGASCVAARIPERRTTR